MIGISALIIVSGTVHPTGETEGLRILEEMDSPFQLIHILGREVQHLKTSTNKLDNNNRCLLDFSKLKTSEQRKAMLLFLDRCIIWASKYGAGGLRENP